MLSLHCMSYKRNIGVRVQLTQQNYNIQNNLFLHWYLIPDKFMYMFIHLQPSCYISLFKGFFFPALRI